MEPVNNVGMTNYPVTLPQSQTQAYDDYSSMPMVYDPVAEEKKESASSGKGLMALGTLALAGLAVYGGFRWGKSKAAKDVVKEAPEEIAKLREELARVQKNNDEAYKIAEEKASFWNLGLKKRCDRIKKALKPEDAKVENKADDVAQKAEGTAAKTEETAAKAEGNTKKD